MSVKKSDADHVAVKDLPPVMEKLRGIHEVLSEEEICTFLGESYPDMNQTIEFESFLRVQWIILTYLILLVMIFHLYLGNKFVDGCTLLGVLKSSSKGEQQNRRQKEIEGICVFFEGLNNYSLARH